jgi:uncharacterized MnhB-related membrane protein
VLYVLVGLAILISAVGTIRSRRLLSSAVWLAAVSALLSVMIYMLGAPQIAVIELSVGAGLVTVLFVYAIGVAGEEVVGSRPVVSRALTWVLVGATVLLLGWLMIPLVTAQGPPHEESFAVVLWQGRGLDVLVQVTLIFSGVLGLLGLLAEAKAPLDRPVAEEVAAQRDLELQALEAQVEIQERELA